ncbi:unnamed protein product [marine sediment metagenome]|uniref:Uncharacterized protein n=1 Tax=marine sediment metagenome TaxID=412755 RepID=X1L3W1_9ZZZZ
MNILNRILIVILILFLLILSLVAMLNTFLPLIDIGESKRGNRNWKS